MNFDDADIISSYTLQDAIADGVMIEIFQPNWQQLSGGKPIVATAHLVQSGLAGCLTRNLE